MRDDARSAEHGTDGRRRDVSTVVHPDRHTPMATASVDLAAALVRAVLEWGGHR